MKRTIYLPIVLMVMTAAGCASAPTRRVDSSPAQKSSTESAPEAESALRKVVGAVTGQEIDQKELHRLGRQIQNDDEARSAVETISRTISGEGVSKYCPVDGQRYGPDLERCPLHNVPLEIVTE